MLLDVAMSHAATGNAGAGTALLDGRAPHLGRQVFREVWDLQESGPSGRLVPPADAAERNPVLGVMWARWQEGARLLGSSGWPCSDSPDSTATNL